MNNQERGEGLISNILAIAGFIILIVIIIWGAYHFLRLASSGFSSLLSRAGASTITLTAPRTVVSGDMLDVSWKYTVPEEMGAFAVLYQCRDGFQLRIPLATSTTPIPCGTPYMIGNKEATAVRLMPMLAGTTALDVPFSIMYMTTGTSTPTKVAQGNATVTITPLGTGIVSATTTPVTDTKDIPRVTKPADKPKPRPVTPPTPKVTGPADLMIRIISVGVIDPISGNIMPRAPISPAETVAVTFDIKNQGGTATGQWYFTANIPTNPVTSYVSPAQKSLNPGDGIENTLRFTQTATGAFTVNVDPSNAVHESNEANNTISHMISAQYGYPYAY
jgi:hypothetical protein